MSTTTTTTTTTTRVIKSPSLLVLLQVVMLLQFVSQNHGHDEQRWLYRASMTPYNLSEIDWNAELDGKVPSTCQLLQVHYVGRHGSTTMPKDRIERVMRIGQQLRAYLNAEQPENVDTLRRLNAIATWRTRFRAVSLLDRGVDEMKSLASSYVALFDKFNVTGTLLFHSTETSATRHSSSTFREAWLSSRRSNFVLPNIPNHARLAFYEQCQRYIVEVKDNETSRLQFTQMKDQPLATQIVERFNQRLFGEQKQLGFSLSFNDIADLYYLVCYENLVNTADKSSAFNELFTEQELKFFDYVQDVETWWKSAYGYDLNWQSSCALSKFIFSLAPVPASQYGGTKPSFSGIFEFGHSETLIPLLAMFGLFKDEEPLTAKASWDFIEKRKFKSSEMAPFGANLAFLFFDCPSSSANSSPSAANETRDGIQQLHFGLVVNGKLQRLPKVCQQQDTCPLSMAREAYSDAVACKEWEICAVTSKKKKVAGTSNVEKRSAATKVDATNNLVALVSFHVSMMLMATMTNIPNRQPCFE